MAGRGKSMTKPAWLVQKEREEALLGGGGDAAPAPPPSTGEPMLGLLASPFAAGPPQHGFHQLPPPPPGAGGGGGGFSLPGPYQAAAPPRRRSPPPPSRQPGPPPQQRGPPYGSAGGVGDVRSRKLFVSGTQGHHQEELEHFFNQTISEMLGGGGGGGGERHVLRVSTNDAKNISFVEFAHAEMMHAVLELQSLPFRGKFLRFQKPKDYELSRPLGPLPRLQSGGGAGGGGGGGGRRHASASPSRPSHSSTDSNTKILVDNVPLDMNEQQFSRIFAAYGPLRLGQLFGAGGRGAVDYLDARSADAAYDQLPKSTACYGMRLSRAGGGGALPPMQLPPLPAPTSASASAPTSVLLLLNMVTPAELSNPQEYDEILEDVESEAKRFGAVRQVVIPKAFERAAGRVFIAYHAPADAARAHAVMHNRTFSGRRVEGRFYSERAFADRVLDV